MVHMGTEQLDSVNGDVINAAFFDLNEDVRFFGFFFMINDNRDVDGGCWFRVRLILLFHIMMCRKRSRGVSRL